MSSSNKVSEMTTSKPGIANLWLGSLRHLFARFHVALTSMSNFMFVFVFFLWYVNLTRIGVDTKDLEGKNMLSRTKI